MTGQGSPRVSVIIPTHNRASMLPRAVDSVLSQTFTDFELLIVDDCSADETPEVAARYTDPRVRAFRHIRNSGAAAARNTGIANSRGEYIAFLDDDDEYLPTKIEKQAQVLDAASADVGMVYVWCNFVGADGKTIGTRCRMDEGYVFEEALALRLILGIGTSSMTRAAVFEDIGGFDEALFVGEDLDFLCRFARQFKILSVPEVLVRLHVGHPQVTTPTRNHLQERLHFTYSHMKKYRADLHSRRTVRAMMWQRIALLEWRTRDYRGLIHAVAASFANDPRSAWYAAKWMTKLVIRKIRNRV